MWQRKHWADDPVAPGRVVVVLWVRPGSGAGWGWVGSWISCQAKAGGGGPSSGAGPHAVTLGDRGIFLGQRTA